MPHRRTPSIWIAGPLLASLLSVPSALAIAHDPAPLGADPALLDAGAKASWARRFHAALAPAGSIDEGDCVDEGSREGS